MKARKHPLEEDVPKIDITGRTNVQKDEEQSLKDDLEKIEQDRRSKLN
jgi:hypothetical protein